MAASSKPPITQCRLDQDVCELIELVRDLSQPLSRPSRQKLVNDTLREALHRELGKPDALRRIG